MCEAKTFKGVLTKDSCKWYFKVQSYEPKKDWDPTEPDHTRTRPLVLVASISSVPGCGPWDPCHKFQLHNNWSQLVDKGDMNCSFLAYYTFSCAPLVLIWTAASFLALGTSSDCRLVQYLLGFPCLWLRYLVWLISHRSLYYYDLYHLLVVVVLG